MKTLRSLRSIRCVRCENPIRAHLREPKLPYLKFSRLLTCSFQFSGLGGGVYAGVIVMKTLRSLRAIRCVRCENPHLRSSART